MKKKFKLADLKIRSFITDIPKKNLLMGGVTHPSLQDDASDHSSFTEGSLSENTHRDVCDLVTELNPLGCNFNHP